MTKASGPMFLALCIFLLVGCAELLEKQKPAPTITEKTADFNANIEKWRGKMDYAGTVERTGIPTRKEVLPDGGFIAEWTTQGGGWVAMPGLAPGLPSLAVPVTHGSTARLRFDAAGLLVSGSYYEW